MLSSFLILLFKTISQAHYLQNRIKEWKKSGIPKQKEKKQLFTSEHRLCLSEDILIITIVLFLKIVSYILTSRGQ